jgi:membrane protein
MIEAKAWLESVERAVWAPAPPEASPWRARLQHVARLAIVLARHVASGQLTLRSMSLVYTTLLSIVPLLALSFSVLKGLGVHNQMEPMLRELLGPLGSQGDEITRHIIDFIDSMNVGVLGSVGLALLFYTAVSLVQKIEESFNLIWHIGEARSLGDRFSRYLSVLLVGPVLVASAIGITATILNTHLVQQLARHQAVGALILGIGKLAPFCLVIGAFAFIYSFVPNTRVRMAPALIAGAVGGVLWQSAGWLFVMFVASSSEYQAIYSSFAILILFLIWLYWNWLVLLFGADVAFLLQHPEYVVREARDLYLSDRMRQRVALAIIALVLHDYRAGGPPWSAQRLAARLHFPQQPIQEVLEALERGGVLAAMNGKPATFLPARDPQHFDLARALWVVRTAGEGSAAGFAAPAPVDELLQRVDDAIVAALQGVRISDLGEERSAAVRAASAAPRSRYGAASTPQDG